MVDFRILRESSVFYPLNFVENTFSHPTRKWDDHYGKKVTCSKILLHIDYRDYWTVTLEKLFCVHDQIKDIFTVKSTLKTDHIMTRIFPAPKDPFDLRTQTFRVNVELTTYYHRHTRKKNFRLERILSDIFFQKKKSGVQRPRWASNDSIRTTDDLQHTWKFFRAVRSLLDIFQKQFFMP